MESKTCPKCKKQLDDKAVKCEFCNEYLTNSAINEEQNSKIELYNPNAAANLAVLLTPPFGAYMLMKNWQTIGDHQKANRSKIWMFALIAIFFIDGIIFEKTGKTLYLFYLGAWFFIECRPQGKYLKENVIEYTKKKWGKLVLKMIGIIIAYLVILSIFSSCAAPSHEETLIENSKGIVEQIYIEDLYYYEAECVEIKNLIQDKNNQYLYSAKAHLIVKNRYFLEEFFIDIKIEDLGESLIVSVDDESRVLVMSKMIKKVN